MKNFRFLEFPVYIASKQFYTFSLNLTQPFSRLFWELGDQLRRAALSICLNIAEGAAKYSDKEFRRFVENALGSTGECRACIDIALENKLISVEAYKEAVERLESITKQLGGLSKRLRSSF